MLQKLAYVKCDINLQCQNDDKRVSTELKSFSFFNQPLHSLS